MENVVNYCLTQSQGGLCLLYAIPHSQQHDTSCLMVAAGCLVLWILSFTEDWDMFRARHDEGWWFLIPNILMVASTLLGLYALMAYFIDGIAWIIY